jgi:hypothetical protein
VKTRKQGIPTSNILTSAYEKLRTIGFKENFYTKDREINIFRSLGMIGWVKRLSIFDEIHSPSLLETSSELEDKVHIGIIETLANIVLT